MKNIQFAIFFFALTGSVYFFGKLLTWVAYKIAPQNFKKEITSKEINGYCYIMFLSIFLWAMLYYFSL